jgi:ESCO1/2 acetyl-transferase
LQVRSTDDKYCLTKVCEVMNIVCDELGYVTATNDFPNKNTDQKAYLCIYENKVIGMILVERIKFGYHIKTSVCQQNDISGTNALKSVIIQQQSKRKPVEAIIGIKLMWVHGKYRNNGIAKYLIDAAREKMVYGIIIPIDKIAFSSPTQAGLIFAVRYCNNDIPSTSGKDNVLDNTSSILIYDCV